MHTILSHVVPIYSGQYFRFQTDNRCKLHFDWMIKWQQFWPQRYQQIGMYDVWGYGVVYRGKFIDDYEYKNNPWIQHGLHSVIGRVINECMLGWACVCFIFLGVLAYTYQTIPPKKQTKNKKKIGPPSPISSGHVKTSRCRFDVIMTLLRLVLTVCYVNSNLISCRWVTQRGYSAVLCKNYVLFCLF